MSDETEELVPPKGMRNRNFPQEEIVREYKEHFNERDIVKKLCDKYGASKQAIYYILDRWNVRKKIWLNDVINQQEAHNTDVTQFLLEVFNRLDFSNVDYSGDADSIQDQVEKIEIDFKQSLRDNIKRFYFYFQLGDETK